MIIGVIADTHDRIAAIEKAFRAFSAIGVSIIVHCGDWKAAATLRSFRELSEKNDMTVYAVLGNNDSDRESFVAENALSSQRFHLGDNTLEFRAGNRNCVVHHGHHRKTLNGLKDSSDYDIVFLGHTHKPLIEHRGTTLYVNPGSVAFSIPRSKTWIPTVAFVNTDTMTAEIVEI